MFGYECFFNGSETYVKHVDTGYYIEYFKTGTKSIEALEYQIKLFEISENYNAVIEITDAFDFWCYYTTQSMRETIKEETLNRGNMDHTHSLTGICGTTVTPTPYYGDIKLVDCAPAKSKACYKKPKQEENEMGYQNNAAIAAINIPSEDAKQRDYLKSRLYDIETSKIKDLRVKFNMDAPKGPKTMLDLIDRIKNDKFTLPEDEWSKTYKHYSTRDVLDNMDWRTTPADKDGFASAEKLLGKAYTDAKDAIMIQEPTEGLKALQAFELQTF